jgi:hypothetical protein
LGKSPSRERAEEKEEENDREKESKSGGEKRLPQPPKGSDGPQIPRN